jgi:hypothetical protein
MGDFYQSLHSFVEKGYGIIAPMYTSRRNAQWETFVLSCVFIL